MGSCFLDTSALVKRYRRESGTAKVDELFDQAESSLLVSRIGVVEVISALAIKVRTGELNAEDYESAKNLFLGDIKTRRIEVVRMLAAHWRQAEALIERHGKTKSLRTLDAIQLAVALELKELGRSDRIVTADAALVALAREEGLDVLNPTAI